MNFGLGVPDFYSRRANGFGEGAIVFVFDEDSKSMALNNSGEIIPIRDSWWASGDKDDNIYENAYKEWREKSIGENDVCSMYNYALSQFPNSLSSENSSGFAVADGEIVSLEKSNGTKTEEEGSADQKLRIINVSPLLCNFRNELPFSSKKNGANFTEGVVDNKGLVESLVFTDDYKKYPYVRIGEGEIIVPFADTVTTNVDLDKQSKPNETKEESTNPEVEGEFEGEEEEEEEEEEEKHPKYGISGVIRGIEWIENDDTSGVDSDLSDEGLEESPEGDENIDDDSELVIDKSKPYIKEGVIFIPKPAQAETEVPLAQYNTGYGEANEEEGGSTDAGENPVDENEPPVDENEPPVDENANQGNVDGIIRSIGPDPRRVGIVESDDENQSPVDNNTPSWRIVDGNIFIPLANSTQVEGSANKDCYITGVVSDAFFFNPRSTSVSPQKESDANGDSPRIEDGVIAIPLPDIHLAEWRNSKTTEGEQGGGDSSSDGDVAGKISMFSFVDGNPSIESGVINIPTANYGTNIDAEAERIGAIKSITVERNDDDSAYAEIMDGAIHIFLPKHNVSGVDKCNWSSVDTDNPGIIEKFSFVDDDPSIKDGSINIPTANCGTNVDSGSWRTGGVKSISVTTSNISSASGDILNGEIRLFIPNPSDGSVDTCNWNAAGVDNRTGTVKSLAFVDSTAYIQDGSIYIPTADSRDEGRTGAVSKLSFVDESSSIKNGQIFISTANSENERAGVVSDIQETSGIDVPVIEKGIIKYPKWEFDKKWFVVTEHTVSINDDSLKAMASSIVDQIGVNVEVSGVVEYLTDPNMTKTVVQFDASSTAYAESESDLDGFKIDTNVATV